MAMHLAQHTTYKNTCSEENDSIDDADRKQTQCKLYSLIIMKHLNKYEIIQKYTRKQNAPLVHASTSIAGTWYICATSIQIIAAEDALIAENYLPGRRKTCTTFASSTPTSHSF